MSTAIDNGVNVQALLEAREALAGAPEAAAALGAEPGQAAPHGRGSGAGRGRGGRGGSVALSASGRG